MRMIVGLYEHAMSTIVRKPTNLTLDAQTVREARALNINLSEAAEKGIRDALRNARAEQWRSENASGMERSNRYVDEHGLPLAGYRQF